MRCLIQLREAEKVPFINKVSLFGSCPRELFRAEQWPMSDCVMWLVPLRGAVSNEVRFRHNSSGGPWPGPFQMQNAVELGNEEGTCGAAPAETL